ncbi:DNA-3-methyladenine glycosylase [Heliorestis acidaminivorans]|uniref:Putative 3-methyladenine DNA glycosylase n=1 Tax=Heliorestis acidaminivorans TaxID=553427 RepID=A0A6I0F5D4_9FIRM|nr:DNA-3-methyladenine glycosylase [Heliorestis acidaminivorans]
MPSLPLAKSFYDQPTLELAQSLLGKVLVKETAEGLTSGIIVETEGYLGLSDRACHSYGLRRTKRTEVMYGPPGHTYTYVMHNHCLMNIVSAPIDAPEAVLIRAIEPLQGLNIMFNRRGEKKKVTELTNGPGKLTQAMAINNSDYGRSLFLCKDFETSYEGALYLIDGIRQGDITSGPRIGIDNYGEAKDYPWRFWVKGNPFVSKAR